MDTGFQSNVGMSDIEAALLDAHDAGDTGRLVSLYKQAGEQALADGDVNRGCFFLTHAYIFALETGSTKAPDLRRILMSYGREE